MIEGEVLKNVELGWCHSCKGCIWEMKKTSLESIWSLEITINEGVVKHCTWKRQQINWWALNSCGTIQNHKRGWDVVVLYWNGNVIAASNGHFGFNTIAHIDLHAIEEGIKLTTKDGVNNNIVQTNLENEEKHWWFS